MRPTSNLHACPNLGERIHVALALYDPSGTYSQHAGVTMTSIFENTSSPVTIHLLHDETLTQDNREKFIRTAEKYSQEIDFVDMTKYMDNLTDEMKAIASGRFTVGTLYRTFISDALPELDKIIYLDCDILVNLDIKELWDIDIEQYSLAGILDIAAFTTAPSKGKGLARALECKLYGANYKYHINGGVLYMNLKNIRKRGNLFEIVKNWCKRYGHLSGNADQDALNSIFYGDIKIVDNKFNVYNLGGNISSCIAHTWTHKPWESFAGIWTDIFYWKMYLRSAWGENITTDDMLDKIGEMTKIHINYLNKECNHSPVQCMKRIFKYFSYHITYHIIPVRLIKLFFSDLYHRIKYKFSR